MKKKKAAAILCILTACLTAGCGKAKPEEPAIIPTKTAAPESTEEPVQTVLPVPIETKEPVDHTGEVRSRLTGLWIKEEKANLRPYAVMLNNIREAAPQWGTSQASILYEALAEGGITRLMGIFEDFDTGRIGSVRSARHYFVSIADEYDAIFVHYGQTKYAVSKISELNIDTLSGLSSLGNAVFYRDNSIKAPHNAFTSYKGIMEGTRIKKYRTTYRKDFEHYKFNTKDTPLRDGEPAEKLTLNFSSYASPWFEYNKENKKYLRFQYGTAHIDRETGKQLAFKNIIVQYVKEWNIDKNGYQTMDIENSSGTGYYLTDGRAAAITWQKNEATKKMHYYDKNGSELILNPGKTYIAVFPKDREAIISAAQ